MTKHSNRGLMSPIFLDDVNLNIAVPPRHRLDCAPLHHWWSSIFTVAEARTWNNLPPEVTSSRQIVIILNLNVKLPCSPYHFLASSTIILTVKWLQCSCTIHRKLYVPVFNAT